MLTRYVEVLTRCLAKELGPRRIGGVIAMPLSPEGGRITGQRIEVHGGYAL